MSSTGVNFSGLGSGIDTESIIQKFLEIEKRPAAIYQNQQKNLRTQQTAYQTLSAQLLGLQSAAASLDRVRAFEVVKASSSDSAVATVTAQAGAQNGQFDIKVTALAKAQLLASTAQSSQTAPLGFEGEIVVNGKAIKIKATDSLQNVATAINSADAGVSVAIISPTQNEFHLTLASKTTGLKGQISLSDSAGGAFLAGTLGILDANAPPTLKNPIGATGAASGLFKDSGTSIATLLGQTVPSSGTITVGPGTISVDFATDSLSSIAAKINTASLPGISAHVVAVTDSGSGETRQQLQIDGTQSFVDSNNVLTGLGVFKQNVAAGRELTAAQDAAFSLNGIAATRSSNTFSDAISGVTISLLKDGGASTTLSISRDTDSIKSTLGNFVQAFNDTVNTINTYSTYDASTGATGILFGDVNVQNVVDGLTALTTGSVKGLPLDFSALSQIGINLNQNGSLFISDSRLNSALSGDLSAISRLFRADGVASNAAVSFVSSTDKTKPSSDKGYEVKITQAAEQAVFTAGTAQTDTLTQDEVLTFGGALFGTTLSNIAAGKQISLKAGSSLQDVVNVINADSTVGGLVSASIENGKLTFTSKSYGSITEFAVISGVKDEQNGKSTGIGTTAVLVRGKDVAGTINGEVARGNGQVLTGTQEAAIGIPNGQALGLQLRVTATQPGTYGTVVFTSGIADQVQNYIGNVTDSLNGTLTTAANDIQQRIDDLDTSLKTLNERAKNTEDNLRQRFLAMETALIRIKSTQTSITQLATSSK